MPVRSGSVSVQTWARLDSKPVGLPSTNGELANRAVAIGCSARLSAELGHHVGLGGEVEVGLHRAGAEHHVQAQAADLGHVGAHDLVAALGHHRDLRRAVQVGRVAEAGEAEAQLLADHRDLGQVLADLLADVVHALQRRAGQFELAAGLQADVGRRRASGRSGCGRNWLSS